MSFTILNYCTVYSVIELYLYIIFLWWWWYLAIWLLWIMSVNADCRHPREYPWKSIPVPRYYHINQSRSHRKPVLCVPIAAGNTWVSPLPVSMQLCTTHTVCRLDVIIAFVRTFLCLWMKWSETTRCCTLLAWCRKGTLSSLYFASWLKRACA